MSEEDKARNAGQKGTGEVKEGFGKVTDDKSLEVNGRADQAKRQP